MAPVMNSHQCTPKIESTFYSQTKQFDIIDDSDGKKSQMTLDLIN